MIRQLVVACAILLSLAPCKALADDNRPLNLLLEPDTRDAGTGDAVRALWKIPANVEARHLPQVSASGCEAHGAPRAWSDPLGHWREEHWQCPQGLAGAEVRISYPIANPNLATIVRLRDQPGGDMRTILLQPHETVFAVPAQDDARGSFTDFLVLGFEHIWIGFDHLLFVGALIFIAGTLRRVLVTISGFTLAHSVTLALASLDIVRVPVVAVETVIALSIVFLAVEIVRGRRDTLTWRRPLVVASAFGLLHGFGFAAVLREIGLPEDDFASALLAFNLGIELGQVMFAAAILLLLGLGAKILPQGQDVRMSRLAGYLIGTLASYWMIERITALAVL